MAQVPWKKLMPEQPADFQMPFWYSSLQSFWLYYPARRDLVEALLPELRAGHGLRLAEFEGLPDRALVSLDFQAYTSGGAQFLGFTREVEFNVYVYPESRLPSVPLMTVREYLLGRDQTKTIGGFRLHVPCDNPIAVQAGQANFGEPKWLAAFDYTVPSLNAGGGTTWQYGVYEPPPPHADATAPPAPSSLIFKVKARLDDLVPEPSNLSPLIEYGTRVLDGREVVAANYWNFFGWFDTYFLTEEDDRRVELTMGPSIDHHRLHQDVRTVIGSQAPLAAQTFTSPPVSSESQAWLESPGD
jgi:hypothetical protein